MSYRSVVKIFCIGAISSQFFCNIVHGEMLYLKDGRKISGVICSLGSETIVISTISKTETLAISTIEAVSGKNPYAALFWASVPGFLGHGLGNIYAENNLLGGLLGGVEIYGLLSSIPFPPYGGKVMDPQTVNCLFWGTWIIDIITAPISANIYNESVKRRFEKFNIPVKIPSDLSFR